MKILYDYQAFDMQDYGGVSNSFVQLISNLPQDADYEIALHESNNVHLRESRLGVYPSKNYATVSRRFVKNSLAYGIYSRLFPKKTPLGRNRICSIESLKQGDYDVFHPTFFSDYFLKYLGGKPYVLTVHDMIPEVVLNSSDRQTFLKKKLVMSASHIIAVSEKTKNDLIDVLKVPDSKVSVVYHGRPPFVSSSKVPIIHGRYILYVGSRSSYKNFIPMMDELCDVLYKHEDINVVCTGNSFSQIELSFFKKKHITDRMICLQAKDSEMMNLYAHALCFVYPSMYEGFGIPILEAYNADCPVLLNDAGCFPEIALDAAVFFKLKSKDSNLRDVMENFIMQQQKERNELIKKQRKRLEFFSWQKAANCLYNVYENVIE